MAGTGTAAGTGTGTGTGDAGGTGTGTGTGTDGKGGDGGKGTGTGGAGTGDDGFPADLGEAGKTAIRAERAARKAAETERDRIAAERDDLKARTLTDSEKAIDAAKKEGAAEATTAANRRIVRSEIKAAAGGKVTDPEDAAALLGDLDRFIVKGEVDTRAISEAISDLVKAKPYLAATAAGKARPLPGGGATQSTGSSFNDDLRRRIRR